MVRVDEAASTQGVEVAEEITKPINLFNGIYLSSTDGNKGSPQKISERT